MATLQPLAAGDIHAQCQFGVDAAKQSGKAVSELALKIYQKVNKPNENLVFSPVSIALGLALVESGAGGETRSEIQRHLAPPGSNSADSTSLYESLQRQLQVRGGDKASLSIANGFFHSDELTVKPEFVNRTQQCFDAKVKQAPFKTDSEAARRQVNQWVAEKTNQKIQELLKQPQVKPSTVAALVNAIHLKAPWDKKFEKIENLPFYKHGASNQAQTVSDDPCPRGAVS